MKWKNACILLLYNRGKIYFWTLLPLPGKVTFIYILSFTYVPPFFRFKNNWGSGNRAGTKTEGEDQNAVTSPHGKAADKLMHMPKLEVYLHKGNKEEYMKNIAEIRSELGRKVQNKQHLKRLMRVNMVAVQQ